MKNNSKTSNEIKCLRFLHYTLFLSTMNELCPNQFYKILIFLTILIDFTATYTKLSVDNDKLCSPITKRRIKLGVGSSSALVVTLGRLREHSLDWDKNFLCKFQVDTTKTNNGLFAVMQNIVFRKNETTDDCIDYVQYKRHDGSSSKKYCGRLHSALGMDPIFAPDVYATNLAPTINSFVDPKGRLDVIIYISREPLHTYEEMELEIVFTSYRYCYIPLKNDQQCSNKYRDDCIDKEFFNDGYVNCPYPDCVDEDGCSEKIHEEPKKSIGNKVIISSVSLLVVIFVFFICFMWLCRKYKKLCWAEDFANSSNTTQNPRTIELNEPSMRNTAMPSGVGTTTTMAVGAGSSDEDKDLPPSYDSLFPDR